MTIRRCRTDDEKIAQKRERELMLRMAPEDEVPTLKQLFTLWDSLLYSDVDVTLPMCICNRTESVSTEQETPIPPRHGMRSGDVRDRVADWISKVPIPDTREILLADVNDMSATVETNEPITEPRRKSGLSVKKFFRRIGRSFRGVLAKK